MSVISDAAQITLLVADYAVMGADGKLTAVGGGWQITQATVPTPAGPGLPGQSVAALVEVPQAHAGEQVALTLTFRNASNEPVLAPAPEGAEPQPLRLAQLIVLQKPQVLGGFVPPHVPCRIGLVMSLPPGLPVPLGETYMWTLHIDDETRADWSAQFYVLAPQAPPVFG